MTRGYMLLLFFSIPGRYKQGCSLCNLSKFKFHWK